MKVGIISKELNKNALVDSLIKEPSFDVCELSSSNLIDNSYDVIVVFGGDGTMLDCAVKTANFGIPIIGINIGNIGFLTEFESNAKAEDVIKAIKDAKTYARIILNVSKDGKILASALNEVVIKSESSRPVKLSLFIDDEFVDDYQSDGIICSTSTGSTGYSLSAGGPVLAPDVDAFIINPICAHTLHSRPLVINFNSKVTFEIKDGEKALVSIDGNKILGELNNCKIDIFKSEKVSNFIKVDRDENFYSKLLRKMNRWGITQ